MVAVNIPVWLMFEVPQGMSLAGTFNVIIWLYCLLVFQVSCDVEAAVTMVAVVTAAVYCFKMYSFHMRSCM